MRTPTTTCLGIYRVVALPPRHEGLRMCGVARSRNPDVSSIYDAEDPVDVRRPVELINGVLLLARSVPAHVVSLHDLHHRVEELHEVT